MLGRTALSGREVLTTYLFGCVLIPLLLAGPLVLPITEVMQVLGLPASWQPAMIAAAIGWMVVACWKLADWHENRFHPRVVRR